MVGPSHRPLATGRSGGGRWRRASPAVELRDSPFRSAGPASALLPGAVARAAGVVARRAWSWNA